MGVEGISMCVWGGGDITFEALPSNLPGKTLEGQTDWWSKNGVGGAYLENVKSLLWTEMEGMESTV